LAGDVLAANDIFMDAFYTDVRPTLAAWRESKGLSPDPIKAFNNSGYLKQIAETRVGGQQAGWGA
jgi:L-rhamnose isomerase/sugar isomerase